jgi:PAS domain S-box-containing protein
MSEFPKLIRHHRSQMFALMTTVSVALLGLAPLVGWWLSVDALRCIVPGSTPLKPNIAAGFVLCGISLMLSASRQVARTARICGGVTAVAVVTLGALTLGEYFFNWNLGIDHWLVHNFPPGMGVANPGRMMPTTAFCFVLVGVAIFAVAEFVPPRFRVPLVAGVSAVLVIVGLLGLGGFALEALFGPRWNLMGMSVSGLTAVTGFMILGAGLLALLQSRRKLTWSLDFLTTVGFGVGILLTVLTTASAFTFAKQMLETNKWVTHRQEVLQKIQEVTTDMVDLASGERLYLITGDEAFLKGREQQEEKVRSDFQDVRKLTADNPNQQKHLDQLEPLIAQRIDWEHQMIAVRREDGFSMAARLISTGPGLKLSEDVRGSLEQMQDLEYRLLGADKKEAESASTATFLLLPLGVFLSLGVLSLGVFFLNAGVAGRIQSERALRESEAQLQTIVENLDEGLIVSDLNGQLLQWNRAALRLHGYSSSEQDRRAFTDLVDTFELSTLEGAILPVEDWPLARILRGEHLHDLELRVHRIGTDVRRIFNYGGTLVQDANGHPLMAIVTLNDITERKESEEEIRQLNVDLERRVERRTAELEAANKELEAFSYSVSHDLRAPLRAVDGFSQAVLEDYGTQLPGEGRHYLQTIREGAQRMGVLIDDLLTFSRLSRLPLNKARVSMGELAREAFEELKGQQNGRKIDIRIGDLAPCEGDPALLKQVWMNLLSNAIKYTRKQDAAIVDVGSRQEKNENVYFVCDNGAGFDMRYANKLFGVFQRLHRTDEFEGTGVGLAIVQRVIHRHGGRIWAEAAVDRGASFYFTMREANKI